MIIELAIYSILFGLTMKLADLTDEHGLKLFKLDNLLFGVLWGVFGILIMMTGNLLMNFMLALIIHWVLRYRIDFFNHGIAATLVLLFFILNISSFVFIPTLFWIPFLTYSVHGLLNDMSDRGGLNHLFSRYFQSNSHYFTVPVILILINSSWWPVLVMSALHITSYEITKHMFSKRGYN